MSSIHYLILILSACSGHLSGSDNYTVSDAIDTLNVTHTPEHAYDIDIHPNDTTELYKNHVESLCLRMHNNTAFVGTEPFSRLLLHSASECRRNCIEIYPKCVAVMFYYLHKRSKEHICYLFDKNSVDEEVALVPEKPLRKFDMIRALEIVADCHQFDPFPPLDANFTESTDRVPKRKRAAGYQRPIEAAGPWSSWSSCSSRSKSQVRSQQCEYGRNVQRRTCVPVSLPLYYPPGNPTISITISYPPFPYKHPGQTTEEYMRIMDQHQQQVLDACCYWQQGLQQGQVTGDVQDTKTFVSAGQAGTGGQTITLTGDSSGSLQTAQTTKHGYMVPVGGSTQVHRAVHTGFPCPIICPGVGTQPTVPGGSVAQPVPPFERGPPSTGAIPAVPSVAPPSSTVHDTYGPYSPVPSAGPLPYPSYQYPEPTPEYPPYHLPTPAPYQPPPSPAYPPQQSVEPVPPYQAPYPSEPIPPYQPLPPAGDYQPSPEIHEPIQTSPPPLSPVPPSVPSYPPPVPSYPPSVPSYPSSVPSYPPSVPSYHPSVPPLSPYPVQYPPSPSPVIPIWSEWYEWSACTATCGIGVQQRHRLCTTEGCKGESIQKRACDRLLPCKTWTTWREWSSCSATCGTGERTRSRACLLGEGRCDGRDYEVTACADVPCSEWGQWESWSQCSAACGPGIRRRMRTCNGENCLGERYEEGDCSLAPCDQWSPWQAWSTCSVSCGQGVHHRERVCLGQRCEGDSTEQQVCMQYACPIWQEWGSWSACSTTCDYGYAIRERECQGDYCAGDKIEIRQCQNHPCITWSSWGSWSHCSASCGQGMQQRSRSCMFGDDCQGSDQETQYCMSAEACPQWSIWGAWEKCTPHCGEGVKTRQRTCTIDGVESTLCAGDHTESAACYERGCCDWTSWAAWSPCSHQCGGGYSSRSRMCLKPGYGQPDENCEEMCYGDDIEENVCNAHIPCAVPTEPYYPPPTFPPKQPLGPSPMPPSPPSLPSQPIYYPPSVPYVPPGPEPSPIPPYLPPVPSTSPIPGYVPPAAPAPRYVPPEPAPRYPLPYVPGTVTLRPGYVPPYIQEQPHIYRPGYKPEPKPTGYLPGYQPIVKPIGPGVPIIGGPGPAIPGGTIIDGPEPAIPGGTTIGGPLPVVPGGTITDGPGPTIHGGTTTGDSGSTSPGGTIIDGGGSAIPGDTTIGGPGLAIPGGTIIGGPGPAIPGGATIDDLGPAIPGGTIPGVHGYFPATIGYGPAHRGRRIGSCRLYDWCGGCQWTDWCAWSTCSVPCSSEVIRRSRNCIGFRGCACFGSAVEEATCWVEPICKRRKHKS